MFTKTRRVEQALFQFIEAIDATGGVESLPSGYAPAGSPDWTDLGAAYIVACRALGRTPRIVGDEP